MTATVSVSVYSYETLGAEIKATELFQLLFCLANEAFHEISLQKCIEYVRPDHFYTQPGEGEQKMRAMQMVM